MSIHPTAIVDPQAQLDDDVEVQPYSIIGPQVTIGSGTVVGPHCVIDGRTVIGKNNRFFSGAQIGILCQDLKHKPGELGAVEIGDNNMFREHVTISASTVEDTIESAATTTIGSNCLLMAYAHVAHDCIVGSHVIMGNCATLAGHVAVEDYAILSGLSAVHQFCVIGRMAFVGGLSAIRKDVSPFMIVDGNPARCCGPNAVGLRRRGLSEDERKHIKDMYRIMFRSGLNTTQAIHEIEAVVEESDVREQLLDFFRKSVRGVTK